MTSVPTKVSDDPTVFAMIMSEFRLYEQHKQVRLAVYEINILHLIKYTYNIRMIQFKIRKLISGILRIQFSISLVPRPFPALQYIKLHT